MAKNKFNELYFDLEETRGRPRAILNEKGLKLVYDLAKIACTDEEISNILGCDIKTLYTIWNREKYKEFKHKGLSEGMMSIRRAQFKYAQEGNASLLIWLGKVYLHQTEYVPEKAADNGIKTPELKITINPASNMKVEAEEGKE